MFVRFDCCPLNPYENFDNRRNSYAILESYVAIANIFMYRASREKIYFWDCLILVERKTDPLYAYRPRGAESRMPPPGLGGLARLGVCGWTFNLGSRVSDCLKYSISVSSKN